MIEISYAESRRSPVAARCGILARAARWKRGMKKQLFYICEICQTVLDEHHCKAICPNCGRMFDCSDLPLVQANAVLGEDDALHARPGFENDFVPRAAPENDATLAPDEAGAADGAHEEEGRSPEAGVANLP
jgi:hypothetical protein